MSAARNAQVAADVAALVAPAVNAVLDPWRAPTSVVLALADALEGKPSVGTPTALGVPDAALRTLEDALCLREAGDSGRADVLHLSRAGSERSFSQFQTAAELGALALTDHVVDDLSRE